MGCQIKQRFLQSKFYTEGMGMSTLTEDKLDDL